ncbi:MAG: YihY/virulence factor BrkB family protein, partial [Microbacterium sp.]|nr:YihY/virulence factor BrkB family protein [Microbacterium sp.]
KDRRIPLQTLSEAERVAAEHQALLTAAQVRLRTARAARESARWHQVWAADRAVRAAQEELAQVEASAPPPIKRGILYD